ncbi:MAG: DUF3857 domain-containing protein, partial [Saprospiraceae bacterium]
MFVRMKHAHALLFLAVLIISTYNLNAQTTPEKWGKLPKSDLTLENCSFDSSAAAMVLQDVGNIKLEYRINEWQVTYNRHKRIKIFNASALDEGNLLIPYYKGKGAEKLTNLDVQHFTPDGEKVKIKSDNIYDQDLTEDYAAKKIFIPNLQKGSIIEYRYELHSEDILTLYPWYFQGELPVRLSDLTVSCPKGFDYATLTNISKPFSINTTENGSDIGEGGARYASIIAHYTMEDMPSMEGDDYVNNIRNYQSNIRFQLKKLTYFSGEAKHIMTSWEQLAKKLEENSGFGGVYQKQFNSNKLWTAFKAKHGEGLSGESLFAALTEFVGTSIVWDGRFRFITENDPDVAFKNGTGSSADVNLSLISLLRKAGLEAFPVLVSSKDHGIMYPNYPFVAQFNSVVALVQTEGGGILLDATNPFNRVGELRTDHYNEGGWIVNSNNPEWIGFAPNEFATIWYGVMKLDESGSLSGSVSEGYSGKAVSSVRSSLSKKSGEAFVLSDYESNYPGTKVD